MKALWAKLVSAFRSLLAGAKQLFYVVWTAGKKEIADILNDPELQELALEAVKQAALRKLQGDEAWAEAFKAFAAATRARGWALGTAMLETILQTSYVVFKYTEGNAAGQVPERPVEETYPGAA